MKLIICIVQDDDAHSLLEEITSSGYRVTKLATTGGFLKSGNTTLLIGVEQDKVDDVLEVVKGICSRRKEIVTNPSPVAGSQGVFMPYPIEIEIGGATIFVIDVDKFIKL
ncbi:MAG: cyclic-di-AMP receptor [Bacillota bacterium]|nr:cyclic-di-AMP receptor [Bacillota bacterium]